jgi:hypothetical protein
MKNLKIDYDKIVDGLVEIIDNLCAHDDNYAAALSYGMLPAPIMDILDKAFRDKLFAMFQQQQGFSVQEGNTHFKEIFKIEEYYKIPQETIREFSHEVCVRLLRHYSKKGVIIV